MNKKEHLDISRNIQKYGFHMVRISPEAEHYGRYFVYSIGLFESLGHPEIMVFLYNKDTALELINLVANEVISGGRIDLNTPDDRFSSVPVIFKEIDKSNFEEYLGIGVDYYNGTEFNCYQMFWPDIDGVYPWDSKYDGNYDVVDQPLLFQKNYDEGIF